jgi:hypothetical protein
MAYNEMDLLPRKQRWVGHRAGFATKVALDSTHPLHEKVHADLIKSREEFHHRNWSRQAAIAVLDAATSDQLELIIKARGVPPLPVLTTRRILAASVSVIVTDYGKKSDTPAGVLKRLVDVQVSEVNEGFEESEVYYTDASKKGTRTGIAATSNGRTIARTASEISITHAELAAIRLAVTDAMHQSPSEAG